MGRKSQKASKKDGNRPCRYQSNIAIVRNNDDTFEVNKYPSCNCGWSDLTVVLDDDSRKEIWAKHRDANLRHQNTNLTTV